MTARGSHNSQVNEPAEQENNATFRDSGNLFELTSYLEGRTTAWGIFEDRFGHIRRRFNVEMYGRWEGRLFHLDERFVYDSGEVEIRAWLVTPGANGNFSATCIDCVGQALGSCTTDSIRMAYKFRLKLDKRTIIVDFDDRIYRMGSRFAVNRATMKKWGVKLGELSLFFQREGGETPNVGPRSAA